MEITEAISQVLINFSNKYPLIAGIIVILFILRPFNKLGTSLFHKKVEKHNYKWNTILANKVIRKWYLRLILWIIDVIFSVKLVSEKNKVIKDIENGKHQTKDNISSQ